MSEDDPFEHLDEEVGDREGDPFERLTEEMDGEQPDDDASASELTPTDERGAHADEPDETGDGSPSPHGTDWVDEYGVGTDPSHDSEREQGDTDNGAGERDSGGPDDESGHRNRPDSSEMTFDVGIRDEIAQPDALSDIGPREGDPFDQMGDTFEQMDTEGLDPDVVWEELTSAQSRQSGVESQRRTYAEVSKHSYCEACRFFTGPPEIECTHEGTEIIEFLDMERVRVVDCPIVAERRELEDDE